MWGNQKPNLSGFRTFSLCIETITFRPNKLQDKVLINQSSLLKCFTKLFHFQDVKNIHATQSYQSIPLRKLNSGGHFCTPCPEGNCVVWSSHRNHTPRSSLTKEKKTILFWHNWVANQLTNWLFCNTKIKINSFRMDLKSADLQPKYARIKLCFIFCRTNSRCNYDLYGSSPDWFMYYIYGESWSSYKQ